MSSVRNILFIMYDQLRHDYLSCAGHPTLDTPHMDRLAARGVRFSNCYVQSPICGSSRMSFYTGRYVHSHGAAWNGIPLKVGEQTLGDHLRTLGMDAWLVGKTHMKVDLAGLERLGISQDGIIGARLAECGFDVHVRDDGLWSEGPDGFYDPTDSAYNAYLRQKGYSSHNPWHDFANAGIHDDGTMASGFLLANARLAANIAEEDSETPWLTREAIHFLDQHREDERPWCCHVSYIKPHWPYIVPSPYHELYGADAIQPVNRADSERVDAHEVYQAFMNGSVARAFSEDHVRETVVPAYMGLIRQCDDQLGVLLDHLDASGLRDSTLIVLCSDHGDYLGDHWLGEKGFFHQSSVKVPLIMVDPSPEAEQTRGTVDHSLVESIDLLATFIEYAGGEVPEHIVEGRSLKPLLTGERPPDWRTFVISEYHYGATPMAPALGLAAREARLFMVADERFTWVHAEGGFRPMLFDRHDDPDERVDQGRGGGQETVSNLMAERLASWARRESQLNTRSEAELAAMRGVSRTRGVLLGVVQEDDVHENLLCAYRGKAPPRPG